MTARVSFEPKHPRIIIEDEWCSSSDEEECNTSETAVVDGKPRRRKTGTQALVEFLNTTSPEEFQKMAPKRTSSFFKRKLKNNNNNNNNGSVKTAANQIQSPPHIVRRKNYIEIIANPLKEVMKSSLTSQSSLSHDMTSGFMNHSSISSINHSMKGGHSGMVLPLPYRAPVKREPSMSTHPRQHHDQTRRDDNDADTIIEQALLQRLEQHQRDDNETPGGVISNSLASEHIRALYILAGQQQEKVKVEKKEEEEEKESITVKKRTRHVQVQTLPLNEKENMEKSNTVSNDVSASSAMMMDNNENILKRLEIAEQELKKERRTRQKLEATLMETTDQFEVLSGLAYMKLRELWEEKLHWENAYLDIKEQSWRHQSLGHELTNSDEGLSLDESYLDETFLNPLVR